MTRKLEFAVEASRCIRCGACAALVPGVFDLGGPACRVARQPSPGELREAEAARFLCPTDAIRARAEAHETVLPEAPSLTDSLFDPLAAGAEAVRWSLADLPWAALDLGAVTPELRLVAREMAFSENATYSATQRFLDAFGDDLDFSRWIAVWFYEETRHPFVLAEWLRHAGEPLSPDFVLRGRVSTPFMRSALGTLITNVVSEVTAAEAYRYLARTSPEPLLAGIASRISGDEARHAASFFRFARQRLLREEGEAARLRARLRGLEVLHAWLGAESQVTHPVQQMAERLRDAGARAAFEIDFAAIQLRATRVVGLALDLPLKVPSDVAPVLRELLARKRS